MAKPAKPRPPVDELRIDQIGYAKEVVAQWLTPLVQAIKVEHKPHTPLLGDVYQGLIIPCVSRRISPTALLRLYDQGKLSKSQLLTCLGVKVAEAEKILDSRTFNRLVQVSPGEDQLRVTLQADMPAVELHDAVSKVHGSIARALGKPPAKKAG